MSKRKGERKADAADDERRNDKPENQAPSEAQSLRDAVSAMPMNTGACVRCPDESTYFEKDGGAEPDAPGREELERRLRTAECCLAQTKEALGKAQAAAESDRKRAEASVAEHRDALARALADFDNYRKRIEREKAGWLRDGRAEGALAALDTLDNLDRAAATLPEANREGVAKVRASLMASLKSLGLEELDPVGQPFDPAVHEAVLTGVSEEMKEDTVLEVLAKGYSIDGKLLRPARVKVSKSR